jgi:hypothetical protein
MSENNIRGMRKRKIFHYEPLSYMENLRHIKRFKVFLAHGTNCIICGAEGKHIARSSEIVKHPLEDCKIALHWDLITDTDMMTVDHIIPKSKGGGNHIENLQPMCFFCNNFKGSKSIDNDQLRELVLGCDRSYKIEQNYLFVHKVKGKYYVNNKSFIEYNPETPGIPGMTNLSYYLSARLALNPNIKIVASKELKRQEFNSICDIMSQCTKEVDSTPHNYNI